MSLEDIVEDLKVMTKQLEKDLSKCLRQFAPAQRVRTGTIRLAKKAKEYRLESIKVEKQRKAEEKCK